MTTNRRRKLRTRSLAIALIAGVSIAISACSAPGDEPGSDSTVLAPLADGFPDGPITLWSAFEPGHDDELFNNIVSQIAADYSPVRLASQSNAAGPNLQYGLIDYLRTQPRSDEGYQVYAIGWFGPTLRLYTVETLAENSLEDLEPINIMQDAPFVFAVPLNSPFESLDDVAEFAQDNPGDLTAVAGATGSGIHSSLMAWASEADAELTFLPTDGSGQSKQTLLGEGADIGVLTYAPGIGDELRILATTGDRPMDALPDVPTAAELGFNIPSGSYRGYGTLPKVPEEHIEWLAELFKLVAEDPRFAEQTVGLEVVQRDADEVRAIQEEAIDVFVPLLSEIGLTVREP